MTQKWLKGLNNITQTKCYGEHWFSVCNCYLVCVIFYLHYLNLKALKTVYLYDHLPL